MELTSVESKLSGSLGERHKILNELVNKASENALMVESLENLPGKKQIDLVYIARLANRCKNAAVLCELLKSQDGMVVSVAMQSKWFFKATTHLEYINVQYFATEVFPYISYHTLCRIISNFGAFLQNEQTAEDFYKYMVEFYNKKLAIVLLPKCSVALIQNEIMNGSFSVPVMQMLSILEKDKHLAILYLDKYFDKELTINPPPNFYWNGDRYNKVLKQLANIDLDMFISFLEKHHKRIYYLSMSKKITKKILKKYSARILENPEISYILNFYTLINSLEGEVLEKFIFIRLPNSKEQFSFYGDTRHLKPECQLKILTKLYPLKYNGELLIHDDNFQGSGLFELISPEDRIAWANKKIEDVKPGDYLKEEHYFKYLAVDEGIARYKSLCKASSNWNQRSTYIESMVECCKINNDEKALLELLKYVAIRHRNDVPSLHYSFLSKIKDSFKISKLSEEHWKILNEMLEFLCIKKEIEQNYWHYFAVAYFKEYIMYCINNGLVFANYIDKIMVYTRDSVGHCFRDSDPKVLEILFNKYKNAISDKSNSTLQEDIEEIRKLIFDLLEIIYHGVHKMSLVEHPWLLDSVVKNYPKWKDSYKATLFQWIKKDDKLKESFSNEIFKYAFDSKVAMKFIKQKPSIVFNETEHFVKTSTKCLPKDSKYIKVYSKIRTYMMNPIGENIIEILKVHLNDDGNEEYEEFGINVLFLSLLTESSIESNKLIKNYAPSNLKVDLEKDKKIYAVGEVMGKYMGALNPSVEYNTLKCYMGGDYFKYCLRSLLGLVYRRPINETRLFISDLIKEPISVRKHFVHLAYCFCPKKELLSFYKSLWQSEKNPSMRNVLFTFTFKLLTVEDDLEKYDEIWQSLKYFMSTFTADDKDLFKYLTEPKKLDSKYIGEYCEVSWNVLKKLSLEKVNINDKMSKLSKSLIDCMEHLRDEFCEHILIEYLGIIGKSGTAHMYNSIIHFVCNFLLKAKTNELQNKNLTITCRIIKENIETDWNKKVKDKYEYRGFVENFVSTLCKQSIKALLELSPVDLLNTVSDTLTSVLPLNAIFISDTLIKLTIMYKEMLFEPEFLEYNPKETTTMLAKKIANTFGQRLAIFLNKLCSKYGNEIARMFVKVYNQFKEILFNSYQKSDLELHIITGLLAKNVNRQCLMMAVDLLEERHYNDENKEHCMLLVNQIISENDETILILLKDKFVLQDNIYRL